MGSGESNLVRAIGVLLATLTVVVAPALAKHALAGEWRGGATSGDTMVRFALFVSEEGDCAVINWRKSTKHGRWEGRSRVLLAPSDGSYLQFSFNIDGDEVEVVGSLDEAHWLAGKMQLAEMTLPMRLCQLAPQRPDYESSFIGTYRFASGRVFVVTWKSYGHLRFTEIGENPRVNTALFPLSQNSFATDIELFHQPRIAQWYVFTRDRDRKINGMIYRHADGKVDRAERIDLFNQERVSIRNGDIVLAGTLLTPLTPGPHPGVVLVHGQGVTHRSEMLPEAASLVERGLAVLIYDLRGYAESEGDAVATPMELADDAFAVLAFMQSHEEISATEAGMMLAHNRVD